MLPDPQAKPLDANERALQRSLENIRFAIEKTLATLRWVDENEIAEHGPLFPLFGRVGGVGYAQGVVFTQHNETSNPTPVGVREALFEHLQMLLKLQQSQAAIFRQRHAWLVVKALSKDAEAAHSAFRARARRRLLADARNSGETPDQTLAKLGREADLTLGRCVAALEANPSRRSFTLTLEALADSMLLKSSVDAGAQATALAALRRGAAKRLRRAVKAYQEKRTDDSARALVGWVARAQLLGCEAEVTAPAMELLSAAESAKGR